MNHASHDSYCTNEPKVHALQYGLFARGCQRVDMWSVNASRTYTHLCVENL